MTREESLFCEECKRCKAILNKSTTCSDNIAVDCKIRDKKLTDYFSPIAYCKYKKLKRGTKNAK